MMSEVCRDKKYPDHKKVYGHMSKFYCDTIGKVQDKNVNAAILLNNLYYIAVFSE